MNRAPTAPGRIAFVGSGPGDPGLLTLRAREALGAAPVVVTDPDVPEGVLALVADGAEVRPAVASLSRWPRAFSPRPPVAGPSSDWSPATR
jgi:siroheme synthase